MNTDSRIDDHLRQSLRITISSGGTPNMENREPSRFRENPRFESTSQAISELVLQQITINS